MSSESVADTDETSSVWSWSTYEPNISWPHDWKKHTNFTGIVYWTSDDGKLVTTDDAGDERTRARIMHEYREYWNWFDAIDDEDAEMHVYNVNMQTRITFASWKLGEIYKCGEGEDELRTLHRSQSWDYFWEFAKHRTRLPPALEQEFIDAMTLIMNGSCFQREGEALYGTPLRRTTAEAHLGGVSSSAKLATTPTTTTTGDLVPALVYHMGQVMFSVSTARSRAQRAQHPMTSTSTPTQATVRMWDLLIGLMLLANHRKYRGRLSAVMSSKGAIKLPAFRAMVRSLLAEWGESNLVAAVILSVNVAFLGIQTLTNLQRTASIVSSLFALMSLIIGLHRVWQHREKTEVDREDARSYLYFFNLNLNLLFATHGGPGSHMYKAPPTPLDLTFTAALLAVPRAALQWAVLVFAFAVGAYAFKHEAEDEKAWRGWVGCGDEWDWMVGCF
ncbi:hypothetical protein R3P38DRAFT_2906754 [Favolaschia claudopus]|uniref:Uncharacterized protein n=1 Tax=Favolaschia claudopus TaxID=2862362 RepID=A0AAW0CJZ5_9AGAR